jgi:hypothetical protein
MARAARSPHILTIARPCRHEINAPTGFERSVPIQAVQFYTAQVRPRGCCHARWRY